jgi:hypothetical protein
MALNRNLIHELYKRRYNILYIRVYVCTVFNVNFSASDRDPVPKVQICIGPDQKGPDPTGSVTPNTNTYLISEAVHFGRILIRPNQ